MRYIGALRGAGTLTCGATTVERMDYELDGFVRKPGDVTGSGEVRMAPEALSEIFGAQELRLVTAEGQQMRLRFTERHLPAGSDVAHVDIVGDAPPAAAWRR